MAFSLSYKTIEDFVLNAKTVSLIHSLKELSQALKKKDYEEIKNAQKSIKERIPNVKDGLIELIKKQPEINIAL